MSDNKEVISTLWGDFETIPENTPETPPAGEGTPPVETPPAEPPKDDTPPPKEDTPPADPPPGEPPAAEPPAKKPEEKPEEGDEVASIFEGVATALEDDELMFLGDDDEYEPTTDGFKQMMTDNMTALQKKMKEEHEKEMEELRQSYEEASRPKFEDLNVENEKHAEYMLVQYYRATGYEDSEIKDKLANLGDSAAQEAKIAKRYLVKQEKAISEKRAAEAQKAKEERDKQYDDYVSGVKESIDNMEEMAGIKLDNKMRKSFKSYLFDKDKDGFTQVQKAGKDPDRRLRVAFLDFIDYSKKDIEIAVKTEVTKEFAKKNARFKAKTKAPQGKPPVVDSEEPADNPGTLLSATDFWAGGENDDDE